MENTSLDLYFTFQFFHNRPIFKESIWGQTRRSKRSKRGQLTQNWKIYLYMLFFGANTHLILLGLQNMDLYLHFTFQFVSLGLFLRILQEVILGCLKRSKRGQSTQSRKIYLQMHFFITDNHFIPLTVINCIISTSGVIRGNWKL